MTESTHLVFASGTPHGGALTSTLALAAIGLNHGARISVVAPTADAFDSNRLWISAAVRAERLAEPFGRATWRLVETRLARAVLEECEGLELLRARDVPAVVKMLSRRPSHIVANSVRSLDLGRLVRLAQEWETPLIWYLRETSSLKLIERWGDRVHSIVANSQPLAEAATALSGCPCSFVPSYVDTTGMVTSETPRTILLVNPIESHGLDMALGMAAEMPDLSFVFQESWPLDDHQRRTLTARIASLPNVELRARCDRAQVYRDAALLLAIYVGEDLFLSRPRVALEAQHLGIPIVGLDTPGLRSVVASPELLLPADASLSAWIEAVQRTVGERGRFAAQATAVAQRDPGLDADEVWRRFVTVLDDAARLYSEDPPS